MFPPTGNSITIIYTQAMFSILWKCFFFNYYFAELLKTQKVQTK